MKAVSSTFAKVLDVRHLGWAAMIALLALLMPVVAMAEQVELNSQIEVEEEFVTLGDIFLHVTHGADHVVSRAPAPGKILELDHKTLKRIADSFRLDWQPRSTFVQATVRRLTTQIPLDEVKAAIQAELIERQSIEAREGITWTVKLEKSPSVFHAPAKVMAEIQFADLRFDQKTGRFQADVELYSGGGLKRLRGEFFATIAVPVPLHNISKNEAITERDLHFTYVRKDKVSPNIQTDISKIIGKSSKRILRADAAIAIQYLQEPLLVKRQRLVSVVYETQNLTLTTKGMAMSDGSMGQVVQVKNLKSNRIIDSVVTGNDEVSVSFAGERLQNS